MNLLSKLIEKKKIIIYSSIFIIFFTVSGLGISYFTNFELEDFKYLASAEEKIEFTDLDTRYTENLWGTPNRTVADQIAIHLVNSSEGLYFDDVNYDDKARASWQTTRHIDRLLAMIIAYGKDLIESDENIREILVGTLNYWLNNDFRSENWWYNDIGTPKILANVGILLESFLSDSQIWKLKKIIERGSLFYLNYTKNRTGANLLDAVDITIKYSFFVNKPYLLKKAIAYAEKEIFISDGDTEGIKPDYTFYQHGAQQAIASYGFVYVSTIAQLAYFLNGTCFQISDEKLDILVDFILYGQRYAIRGNQSNYLTNGRGFSRKEGNNANSLKGSIGLLLTLENIPQKSELQQFYNSFNNISYSLENTTYFPYSHTLFAISPDYYMAVKGAYKGFTNSERINSENILARNMGYGGVTTYQYYGTEYNNIAALWDFSMLPGTTAYHETDESLAAYSSDLSYYASNTKHSGGAADGEMGGLYVDIENEDGLYCRQAYISYKGLMVCLGNSLKCSNSSNTLEIFTTIDQVFADNATYKGSAIGETTLISDNSPVYNGKFAYYNLGEKDPTAVVNHVIGDFHRNNLAVSGNYSGDIFKLYYSYGINPENENFAYAVCANANGLAPTDDAGLLIEKVTNSNEIQAVEFTSGKAVIIFHKAGSFTTIGGSVISAEEECVKIINK